MDTKKFVFVISAAVCSAVAGVYAHDLNDLLNENEIADANRLAFLHNNDAGQVRKERSAVNLEDPLQVDEGANHKAERVKALTDVLYSNLYVRRKHRVRQRRQADIKVDEGFENKPMDIILHHIIQKRDVKEDAGKPPEGKQKEETKNGITNYVSNAWKSVVNCLKNWYSRLFN